MHRGRFPAALFAAFACGWLVVSGGFAADEKPAVAAPPDFSGVYACAGQDFDDDKYTGRVTITRHGETYQLAWDVTFQKKRLKTRFTGVGLQTGDVLAASWASAQPGVMLYRLDADGVLAGRWTLHGQKTTREELLTPAPVEKEDAGEAPPRAKDPFNPGDGRDA